MTDRENLIELFKKPIAIMPGRIGTPHIAFTMPYAEELADHLIANGVVISKMETVATDNNVGSKWIPVTERLPDEKELVLILCKNGATFVGYCGMQYADLERRWRIKTALNSTKLLNLGRVTHWMCLPEPPKGD